MLPQHILGPPSVRSPEGSPAEGCRVRVDHRLGHRHGVPVCNRDAFSVWASVCTLALGSTRVGTRPTAEGNAVVQKIPLDLKEASNHFPLPSRYPPCTHLNHKAAEEKALALPISSLSPARHPETPQYGSSSISGVSWHLCSAPPPPEADHHSLPPT